MFGLGETVFGSGETEVRGKWVLSPCEIGGAWKTVVPRTKEFSVINIGLLLYMIGLSAISHEMLSTY